MNNKGFFLGLTFLFLNSVLVFSQKEAEFSLLKTPEQKALEAEANDLKFQDFFFDALKERVQDNYDKAITALNECDRIYPNHVAVNFEFAKNYFDLKQYQNALDFIQKTLKDKPNEFYVLEMAVKTNMRLFNYPEAIALQKKLVKLNPDQKNGLIYLYILNKQKEKAKELYAQLEKEELLDNRKDYFKKVLFPNSNNKETKNLVVANNNSIKPEKEQFYKTKSYKDLKTLLEKELLLKKYDDMVVDSSEGLSLFPAQPFVYYSNGLALNAKKRYKEALESLENALDYILDENKQLQQQIFRQMAISYQGLGDVKNANKYKNKALK